MEPLPGSNMMADDATEESSQAAGLGAGISTAAPLPTANSTRVDRLLQERIRRNRSHQQFGDFDEATYEGPLPHESEAACAERLVVVANRLPVTCSKDAQGQWHLQVSAGGLVSALKGVTTYKTIWIGWPGIWVKPGKERELLAALLLQEGCIPVWVEPTLLDMYYNGFCNSVLWQLFHYVPLNIDSWLKMSEHKAMQMQWQAYQVANQKFADVVLENYEPNDIMWVQDYHLMLLPSLLKAVVPKMKVGFFLHTPFPSSEMYRTLPVREEVLRAVLGADLIGFHTYDYARHFISSCTRILGLEGTPEGVENNGSITRVGTFPIGIDPERFTRALETDEVQSHVAKLLNKYAGRKIMLGVDRLDMVKGIPQKLLAFEKFLEEHAEWRDKVLLVQIAVPSRTDVPEYQKLRSMVHEIVGRINGAYGTLTYVPIYHLDTSLSFTELCALYAVTDVAVVSSLRDGMNLVSYEYVACQSDNAGVLVLSEFAGAAQSLGAGAILVNPWNINDMAQAIEEALCMSEEERRERHRQNYMHVQTHTAQNWADTFISELNDTHIEADLRMRHAPPPLDIQEVVNAYKNSTRRLIVLGYNATLTTHIEAAPGRAGGAVSKRQHDLLKALAKPNPRVLACIQDLCQDPCNLVAIFSGSETSKLEEIFGDLPVWLAAENGVFVRPPPQHVPPRPGQRAWRQLFDGIHKEWMESVQLVFDYFCERTPRSFVETRETSLVWNYKHADVEFGRIQARDLLQHLWTGPISNAPVEIIQGGKSVEVRPVGVTKGTATGRMVQLMSEIYGVDRTNFDFVLCIGHLLGRDENMFSFFEGVRVDGSGNAAQHGARDRGLNGGGPAYGNSTGSTHLQGLHHHQANGYAGTSARAAQTHAAHMAAAAGGNAAATDPFRNAAVGSTLPPNVRGQTAVQVQYAQQHLAQQQAQHPELYARLQAAAVVRAAAAAAAGDQQQQQQALQLPPQVVPSLQLPPVNDTSYASMLGGLTAKTALPTDLTPNPGVTLTGSQVASPTASNVSNAAMQAALAAQSKVAAAVARGEQRSSIEQRQPVAAAENGTALPGQRPVNIPQQNNNRLAGRSGPYGSASAPQLPAFSAAQPGSSILDNQVLPSPRQGQQQTTQGTAVSNTSAQVPSPRLLGNQETVASGSEGSRPAEQPVNIQSPADRDTNQQGAPNTTNAHQLAPDGNVGPVSHPIAASQPTNKPGQSSPSSMPPRSPASSSRAASNHTSPTSRSTQAPGNPTTTASKPPGQPPRPQDITSPNTRRGLDMGAPTNATHVQGGFVVNPQPLPTQSSGFAGDSSPRVGRADNRQIDNSSYFQQQQHTSSNFNNNVPTSPTGSGIRQAVTNYLQTSQAQEQRKQFTPTLPPKFLFTCTVGRNRSKARYALGAASEVADLLDAIVQQAIYHKDPPSLPNLHDLHIAHAMNRVDSYSSAEPLSPDSMFTLISNWKTYRALGSYSGAPSAPDLLALAGMQQNSNQTSNSGVPTAGTIAVPPGSANRRSRSGQIGHALAALAAATNVSGPNAIAEPGSSAGYTSSGQAPGTPVTGPNTFLPASYLLSSPMGNQMPDPVPEDPVQEDLQVSAESNLVVGLELCEAQRTRGASPPGHQASQGMSSSPSLGPRGMPNVTSGMLVGDLDVGPSVSQQGTPSPQGSLRGESGALPKTFQPAGSGNTDYAVVQSL